MINRLINFFVFFISVDYNYSMINTQALKNNRLYILDHHDSIVPYLRRINSTSTKMYATRTILFLKYDGTLKPLAIELCMPDSQNEGHGVISQVYTPAKEGVEASVWQLAKAFAAVSDSGCHQLISHWYNPYHTIVSWT